MDALPFRYEDWLRKTSAGAFSLRSPKLKALDEAIRQYDRHAGVGSATRGHADAVRGALMAYIAEEEARGGVEAWKRGGRNNDRIIESLVTAMGLGADRALIDRVQAFRWDEQMVPDPPEEKIPDPPRPPPLILDMNLEARAARIAAAPPGRPSARPSRPMSTGPVALEEPPAAPHMPTAAPAPMAARPSRSPMGPAPAELVGHAASEDWVLREVDQLASDLHGLRITFNANLTDSVNGFADGVDQGFTKFKELFTANAEATAFKLSLVKSAFEALEAAPFPLSVVGKIGKTVVGLAQVDTKFTEMRNTLPTPAGIVGKMEAAGAAFNKFRTVGVSPSDLPSHGQVKGAFREHVTTFQRSLSTAFKAEVDAIEDRHKRKALAGRLAADTPGNPAAARQEITRLLDQINANVKAMFKPFLDRRGPSGQVVADWIALQMIADYAVTGLCGFDDEDKDEASRRLKRMTVKDLGGKKFGDEFARFMACPELGIVQLKNESGESSEIYGAGKIPWDGSANHVVAVILFLDWYRRSLNPFDLLTGVRDLGHFRYWSKQYIGSLGYAMAAHKQSAVEMVDRLGGPVDDEIGSRIRSADQVLRSGR